MGSKQIVGFLMAMAVMAGCSAQSGSEAGSSWGVTGVGVTNAGTRDVKWIQVGEELAGAQLVTNSHGVSQPVSAGWYLGSIGVVEFGLSFCHLALGHFTGTTWDFTTALQGGSIVPTEQGDFATHQWRFRPVTKGSAASSLSDAEWSAAMFDDVKQLSMAYRCFKIHYSFLPTGINGNSNTYLMWVLLSLGGYTDELFWLFLDAPGENFPGADLVHRDAFSGQVWIQGVSGPIPAFSSSVDLSGSYDSDLKTRFCPYPQLTCPTLDVTQPCPVCASPLDGCLLDYFHNVTVEGSLWNHPVTCAADGQTVYNGASGTFQCKNNAWVTASGSTGGSTGGSTPLSHCTNGNTCYVTAGGQATDGNNPDPQYKPVDCAQAGQTDPGTDGATSWTCSGSPLAWVSALPGCSATNACYLTSMGQATDGNNPDQTYKPVKCAAVGTTAPGTPCASCKASWTCVGGQWQ